MELVEDNNRSVAQRGIILQPAQQDAFGDKADTGAQTRLVVEPHLVANLGAQSAASLPGHAPGHSAGGDTAGLSLTESFAMYPAAAVSGFYFGHRDSQYFGVATVGRDQLEDYAARRGIDLATAEKWLRPNLD